MIINCPYEEYRSYPPVENDPVDVVLPWLNPTEKWKNIYLKYSENENICRIRDLGTIIPTINGIIKNLSFIRYIWLIVFDEEQLCEYEKFLNNSKIRIVFHKDIIPEEFLPNFNSLLPAMYCYKINGLSNNFIFMNDDMIINNPISKENYFINGKPVHQKTIKEIKKFNTPKLCLWHEILESTHDLLRKITNGKDYSIENFHMPIPLTKNMYEFIWNKYNDVLYKSCINAKIRKNYSISMPELIYWLEEIYNFAIFKDIYKDIKIDFVILSDNTSRHILEDAKQNFDIICLNDSENLEKNSLNIKKYITELFN